MKWTRTGRKIYAVGSNPSAAEVSGINVRNIKLLVYMIMGFLAGLGGALQVSIYASAMPDMQQGGEMDVIAACVIGGVSMNGGRGSVIGALLGSLILATIAKALPLVGFDALWQNTIKGVLILVVVMVNIVLQRISDKNALKGREM
jgi:rhamnose transport system permease protein